MEYQTNPKYDQSRSHLALADLDNLPDPDELAVEIIENLEAGLESFREVLRGLKN